MLQTKNALNNLIARYKSILAHCKLLNVGLFKCALAVGVSTCIILNENAWAEELSSNITTNKSCNSGEVASGTTIYVWGATLAVKDKLTNNGTVNLVTWGMPSTGTITADSVDTNGSFTVDGSTLTVTNTLTNSGNFILNGDATNKVTAKNFINNGGEFKINNGTVNITEKITNTANFFVINGNITANALEHSAGLFELGNGTVDFDSIKVTGGQFTYQGGTLTTDSIENSATFTMSSERELTLITLGNKGIGSSFGVNDSKLTVETVNNEGKLAINTDNGTSSEAIITNLNNAVGGVVQVNGDKITQDKAYLTVKNATTNRGHYQFNSYAIVKFENFLTNLGTVEVQNTGTELTVNGDFINGDANNKATLHIHDDDAVVHITGNLQNENGIVGVHSGTLTIDGVLTNNSTAKSQADSAHNHLEQESIHVHDATLKTSTLYLNRGGLGLYHDGKGVFTSAFSGNDAEINILNNGSFTANNGALTGTLFIEGLGHFIKTGTATDILTVSNTVTNEGTMKVTNGGLVIKDLKTNATHGNDFITNGNVIVTGQNSYLQTGNIHQDTMKSLLNNGYVNTDVMHSTLTMQQATVALNDGIGIVLGTNNDKLIVSNSAVNDTDVTNAKTVDFGSGTLFKFNGDGFDRANAAITVDGSAEGSVSIADDAKFLATNLKANTYYTLIANVASTQADVDQTGWQKDVESGSLDRMIEDATIKYVPTTETKYGFSNTNDIVLVSGKVTDKNFGIDEDLFENMKDLWEAGKNDKDSPNAGTGFVSGAADRTEIADDGEAGKTLESALNVAVTGGIAGMTTDASDIASQAVNHRIDGVRAEAGDYYEDISATDWGLWAIPLYQQSQVRDMKIGANSGGNDSYITGAIIGLDRKKDEWTCGIAFGLGFGEAESVGNYASTKTQLDFWSAILYGAYHRGNFELKGDFTYTQTRSKINQDNPYHLVSMSNISADVDSQLYSLGTTASYRMEGEHINLTPHIGVRYRAYHQGSFTSTLGGRELFHVHDGHMETWLLPVGVTLSDTFLHNDWLITPRLDISYTAVFGDTTIMNRVNIAGSGADVDAFGTANIEADVLDYGFISLSLGCGAKKEDWSFGLDFDFQKSKRRQAQGVFARAAYRF